MLEAYVSCRLLALDKNPGIRPIGVGEVLRRIVGKTISFHCKNEIKDSTGPLQTCAGHGSGAESAIHAMREIFQQDETDAVLLIDARNAFNCLNRGAALHNIQITCPILATYIINTYRKPAALFIPGGEKIFSKEGTTQGDPLAMPWYSLSTVTIIDQLKELEPDVKQVWLADDASAAGKLQPLFNWYKKLESIGNNYGYHVKQSKCWLIVKTEQSAKEAGAIFGASVNITVKGKRHLGACIGSEDFKKEYCTNIVDNWLEQLNNLCEIADTQPQAAFIAYTKGFKSKFSYFLRTIEGFQHFTSNIDSLLKDKFIPTLFGDDSEIILNHRDLLSLNPSEGGLGINELSSCAIQQYNDSVHVTKIHVDTIINQHNVMPEKDENGKTIENLKSEAKSIRQQAKKLELDSAYDSLCDELKPYIKQARDKGASAWLNAIPLKDQHLNLNKEEFRDALCLRYNLPLKNLPSKCPCGEKFTVCHAMNCKKGGFIVKRHDNLRDFLTVCLDKTCNDVEKEPRLIPISNEAFDLKSANVSDEARLDIKARGFWRKGETAFFDIRVTHVNSESSKNLETSKQFHLHEEAKKREYLQRVLNVEHGSFTPLVFGTNGGVGSECERFLVRLAYELSEKTNERYSSIMTWLRIRISMELTRASLLCLRGSRVPFRLYNADDIGLNNFTSGV